MLLQSLELQGFKTFPDKTTLRFEKGITAVVGPNGSGKSNISDAVRWVLGEQSVKTLRCSRMEDVIFSGTPARKPLGYAEVTLTIDNSTRELHFDGDTVAITRRYYRSGESEYLINRAAVRLKDIHELFMDTGLGRDGYSIIGQGKIDSIVAARSEDRREIFEEAAGISRFRYRKEDAQRQLDKAEDNLLRLQDIVSELESRIAPLREQAEKAQRFLSLSQEKKTLEIGLWLHTLDRSGRVLREQGDKITLAQSQQDKAGEELEALAAHIEENYRAVNNCTAQMEEMRKQASAQEEAAARLDGEISVLENDILHNRQNGERFARELEQFAVTQKNLDWEIAARQTEIQVKETEAAAREEEFRKATENLQTLRREADAASAQVDALSVQVAEKNAALSEARVQATGAQSAIREITARQDSVEQMLLSRRSQEERLQKEIRDNAAMLSEMDARLESLQNTVRGYELRVQSRQQKAEEQKRQNDRLHLDIQEQLRRAKVLEDLERNLEGFAQSVKAVMKEAGRGNLPGIHGPLSRLFRVPQQYAVAIETAMGAAMQNIVVGAEEDAKAAIRFLKQRDAGRATFLPLSTIHGSLLQEPSLENCPGFVGVAASLCSCDDQYEGVLNSVLGRIAIAEDLDSAVAIARRFRYRFRIVTLDGQVVNTGGSLTGGSRARNSGLLSRASEIVRIREKAAAMEQNAQAGQERLKALTAEASAAQGELSAAKGELASAQEERFRTETEGKRLETERQAVARHTGELEEERRGSGSRLESLQQELVKAQEKERQLSEELEGLQSQVQGLTGSREDLMKRSETVTASLQEIRMAALEARKDRESLEASVEELRRRKEDSAGRQEELQEEIRQAEQAVADLQEKIAQRREEAAGKRESAKDAEEKARLAGERRMELEKRSGELRAAEREKNTQRENMARELARLEERRDSLQKEYDGIISRLWEEYELTRREAEQMEIRISDSLEAQKRLNEIKLKIRGLGSVNVSAIEEYGEVSQRYEFLMGQMQDVQNAKEELVRLIHDLTRHMQELFTARFQEISGHFTAIFKELFGGGNAALSLSDPSDVLHSGIDIAVQPPGKIVTHIESLSGGEMALVAISIYFAIMKVSPPPFCVLDEIEAALDDVNVTRFAAYLRRMNRNTQFIAITHRRGTMEEADVLYGVTMQDQGISKLLELRNAEDSAAELGAV